MMSIHVRRRFIYLFSKNAIFLCEPRASLSAYFSTYTDKHPENNTNISESLMQKYHFHSQAASNLASLKSPPKSDTILPFFEQSGFSVVQLEKLVKFWPQLLSLNLDKIIKPKFKIFHDFGFSAEDIVEIISKDPRILHSSAEKRVVPSLSLLKDLLGSPPKVAKVLKASGWYAKSNLDNTLVPNIKYLTSCGVDMDKIFLLMYYAPRILLQKPENMKKFVEKAEQMGADRSSKVFIHAVHVVTSMNDETWELKLKAFRDMGFSKDDIFRAFRGAPMVFGLSVDKMKKVKEIILATGNYDMQCIVKNPTSLCRSIEKRYKPRIQVLKILVEKNLIVKWPGFSALYKFPDVKFYERFVSPYYDEVGEVYRSMTGVGGKREVKLISSL